MTMKRSTKKWSQTVTAALMISTLLVGCANNAAGPDNRTTDIRNVDQVGNQIRTTADRNGNGYGYPMNYRDQRTRTEGLDTIMGRNANPNLVIGHQDVVNPTQDVRNMEMMAKTVPGVEQARITINGGNAYVSLDLVPNVTADQARAIEDQVIRALYQKVPRYDFHMTSNDGYHR